MRPDLIVEPGNSPENWRRRLTGDKKKSYDGSVSNEDLRMKLEREYISNLTKSRLNPILEKAKAKDETVEYRSPANSYAAISGLQTGAIEQVSPEFDILTGILGVASMAKPKLKGIGAVGNPVGVVTGGPLKSVGDRLMAAKQNVYKINPWAFKPNPEAYYRGVGKEGLDDILESGIIRSKKQHAYPEPYFSKGLIGDKYAKGYFVELTGEPMKGVGSFSAGDLIQTPVNQISINNPNLKLYKEHWLKGYKEIKTRPASRVEFKSEIDWAKWNADTPKHKVLIDEYNAIEESTKKAGTWMKNPDGSVFQGTPEQFVQQQSSWFKKAFENSKIKNEIVYHGTHPLNKFEEFDPLKISSNSNDKAFYFARDKNYAKNRGGRVIEAYLDIQNPTYGGYLEPGSDGFIGGFMGVRNPTQIKSAKGNVGFFDMTNPNIYKSVATPIAAGGLLNSRKK